MPDVSSYPFAPHYQTPPVTKEGLEYADLAIIDLAKMSTSEGRLELVETAKNAMRDVGFFYVVNHGLSLEKNQRMFDIADLAFSQVSDAEKKKYEGKMLEEGSYRGYKLREYWHIDNGVRDQIEQYNINKDINTREHPAALRPFLPEIDEFIRHNHFNILHPILRLLALGLEIPEDTFVNKFGFDAVGDSWARCMKYYPRTDEDETKTKNVWLKGHTDFGGVTILWSQPVSGLQIRSPDGKWRWIRYMENALVINIGDCTELLSGGYYKATIHRVVQPPSDQQGYPRVGVFYFAIPNDEVRLVPIDNSPVLAKHGIQRRIDDDEAPTVEVWRKGRVASYGTIKLQRGPDEFSEVETVAGLTVKHYN